MSGELLAAPSAVKLRLGADGAVVEPTSVYWKYSSTCEK
jgi:hypothetical protein